LVKGKCNTFTPQIKGISENTYAMYTSPQGYILVYIQVDPGKVVALLKEQATFIKARIALM